MFNSYEIKYWSFIKNKYLDCVFIASCDSSTCLNGGTCISKPTAPYFQCICDVGYSGSTCLSSRFDC